MCAAIADALVDEQPRPLWGRLEDQPLDLSSEISSEHRFEGIVGKSTVLRKVLDQVAIVAPTGSTVLLHGETGTGKELLARAIHNLSPRRQRTFVRLNCAAIHPGWWKANCLGTKKALSLARSFRSGAASNWPMAALSFSMRSVILLLTCSPSCYALYRNANLNA